MPFATLHRLSAEDLLAMASGVIEDTVTDLDFLETLGAKGCFLVPPFVLRADRSGALSQVARIVYNTDGKLDKPRILLSVARALSRRKLPPPALNQRFSI